MSPNSKVILIFKKINFDVFFRRMRKLLMKRKRRMRTMTVKTTTTMKKKTMPNTNNPSDTEISEFKHRPG